MLTDLDAPYAGPPIEPDGPYDSRLSSAVSHLPIRVRNVLDEAGGMVELFCKVLWSAIRHPRGYWTDLIDEIYIALRKSWIPITIALCGFLVAQSVPEMHFTELAGVSEFYGPLLFMQATRTFTVWVIALLIAGVIGAAVTAELGSRKVREELDAMTVMGIDPIRVLVVPRFLSIVLMTVLLAVPAEIISMLSAQYATYNIGHISAGDFYNTLWITMSPIEIGSYMLNALLAGLLVGAVCCYKGMAAAGGAIGLGRAVNQAVVISFVALFVMQLGYNAVVLGLFPNMGAFK